jgi:hypothetical protein
MSASQDFFHAHFHESGISCKEWTEVIPGKYLMQEFPTIGTDELHQGDFTLFVGVEK